MQQVEGVDGGGFNTRQVSESLDQRTSFVEDNQRTLLLNVSSVSVLSFSRSDLVGILNSFDIFESVEGLEDSNSLLGLFEGINSLVVKNQRNFRDTFDSVTTSQD